MNNLPYDFVDRVFTKLNDDDIRSLNVDSPIWKEAHRVYNKKLTLHVVFVCFDSESDELFYKIHESTDEQTVITLDEALQWDPRFKRVDSFIIKETGTVDLLTKLATTRLLDLLEYVGSFNLTQLFILRFEESPKDFQDKFVATEFRTSQLFIDGFPDGTEFARKQLKSGELESFNTTCLHGNGLKDVAEAFVYRRNFKGLMIESECFGMEDFKRIVDYWKVGKPKTEWHIYTVPGRNFHDEFASWMTLSKKKTEIFTVFEEKIGNFVLTIECDKRECNLHCEKIIDE